MSYNYVLVGRPNVGKSSIFNFLISKHEAFVKDEDGTTIDWRSKKVGNITIWDTPGVFKIDNMPPCKIDKVFLILENNVLEYDKKLFIDLKRKYEVEVIINKADLEKNKISSEDYSFFKKYTRISLKARIGLFELKNLFFQNHEEVENLGTDDKKKKIWAIIGKPNVGKSSLINLMVEKQLHKVEDFDGTTKEFLPVDIDENILLDTPGQRKRALFPKYSDVFGIIFVTDLKQERQDLRLIGMALDRKKPLIVIINKIDLAKSDEIKKVEDKINQYWHVPVMKISCTSGKKYIKDINKNIEKMEHNYEKRITTSDLNSWLQKEIKKIEPKIKFITQISTGHPKFFVDCKLELHKEKMLKKRLSRKFDFAGIYIELKYKE